MRLWLATVPLVAILYCGAIIYRPAPVIAAPVKVASWLKTDKLQGKVVNPPWPEKIVQTEEFKNTLLIPSSCARLAAREGERLPSTDQEMQEAKRKVVRLARKGDVLAIECRRAMKAERQS